MARARSTGRRSRSKNDHICLTLEDRAPGSLTGFQALSFFLADHGLIDSPLEGIADKRSYWPNGQTIRVAFVDSSRYSIHKEKVKQIAPEWTKHANLDFDFVEGRAGADITISFAVPNNYSSLVGTTSRSQTPSMLLGFLPNTPETEYRSLILHEFGHALGLHHEHQNPEKNPIDWDPPRVIDYFWRTFGWPPQKTIDNVLSRLEADSRRYLFTNFDEKSIMLYAFPSHLTRNGYGTERSSDLSESDIAIIRQIYPGRPNGGDVTAARELKIDGASLKASLKPSSVDRYWFSVGEANGYVIETTGDTDVVMGLYGPEDETRLVREDDDSGGERNARILKWLEPGKYHVKVRVSDFVPGIAGDYGVSVKRYR